MEAGIKRILLTTTAGEKWTEDWEWVRRYVQAHRNAINLLQTNARSKELPMTMMRQKTSQRASNNDLN
jgi:hypothetical protein